MASASGNDCSEIRMLLSTFIDGEATPEEAARAQAHVATCEACASYLAFLRLTGNVLRRTPEVTPSYSLSARIAAATYERPTFAQRIATWLSPVPTRALLGTAVAAGVAAVFIVPRLGTFTSVSPVATGDESTSQKKSSNSAAHSKPAVPNTAVAVAPKAHSGVPSTTMTKPGPEVASTASLASTNTITSGKTVLPPPHSVTAPSMVASVTRPKNAADLMARPGGDTASINNILSMRTDPGMDRHIVALRGTKLPVPGSANRHTPRSASIVPPRSGYDRQLATMGVLHPTEVATVPTVSSRVQELPQPRVSPTPTVVASETLTAHNEPSESTTDGASAAAAAATAATAVVAKTPDGVSGGKGRTPLFAGGTMHNNEVFDFKNAKPDKPAPMVGFRGNTQ